MPQASEEVVVLVRVEGADTAKRTLERVTQANGEAMRQQTQSAQNAAAASRGMGAAAAAAAEANRSAARSTFTAWNTNFAAAARMGGRALTYIKDLALSTARHVLMVASATTAVFTAYAVNQSIQREQVMAALTAIMGGADKAAEHFKVLQKLSLLPGVTLDVALQVSQRLQAVGISAKVAADAVREFGNAAALSGAGADSLNRATVQLSQMVGKGKVMAEDVRVIAESIPTINRVLVETFGTSSAEKIQAMGYSAKEFVAILVEGFSKLPRAGETFANKLTNVKMALQELAIAFGKGFIGLEGKDVLDTLAKAFERLKAAAEMAGKWVAQAMKEIAQALKDRTATTAMAELVLALGLGIAQVITAFRQMDLQVRKLMTNIAGAWSVVMALINTPVDPKNPTAVWDAMARAWRKWGQAARGFADEQKKIDDGYQQMDAAARKAAAAVTAAGQAGAKAGQGLEDAAAAAQDAAKGASQAADSGNQATESARVEGDVMGTLAEQLWRVAGMRVADYMAARGQTQATQRQTASDVAQTGVMGMLLQHMQRLTGLRVAETTAINANTAALKSNNAERDKADARMRQEVDRARQRAMAQARKEAAEGQATDDRRDAAMAEYARRRDAETHAQNLRQARYNVQRYARLAGEQPPTGAALDAAVNQEVTRLDSATRYDTTNLERQRAERERMIASLRRQMAAEENEAVKKALAEQIAQQQSLLEETNALIDSYTKAAEKQKQMRAERAAEEQRYYDARAKREKDLADKLAEYERQRRDIFGKPLKEQAQDFYAAAETYRNALKDFGALRNRDTEQNAINAGLAVRARGGAIANDGRITAPREVQIGGIQLFSEGLAKGLKDSMKEATGYGDPRRVTISISGQEQARAQQMSANDRITQAALGSMGAGDDAILAQAKLNQEADMIRSTVYSGATSITRIITQSMAEGFAEAREETKAMVARFMGHMVGSAA